MFHCFQFSALETSPFLRLSRVVRTQEEQFYQPTRPSHRLAVAGSHISSSWVSVKTGCHFCWQIEKFRCKMMQTKLSPDEGTEIKHRTFEAWVHQAKMIPPRLKQCSYPAQPSAGTWRRELPKYSLFGSLGCMTLLNFWLDPRNFRTSSCTLQVGPVVMSSVHILSDGWQVWRISYTSKALQIQHVGSVWKETWSTDGLKTWRVSSHDKSSHPGDAIQGQHYIMIFVSYHKLNFAHVKHSFGERPYLHPWPGRGNSEIKAQLFLLGPHIFPL